MSAWAAMIWPAAIIGVLALLLLGVAPWRRTTLQLLRRSQFAAAVLLLGMCAITLNGATSMLSLHFRKLPLPLRVTSLTDPAEGLPARLGTWVQVTRDQPIDPELEQQLGTHQYLFRDYVDARQWPGADLDALRVGPASNSAAAVEAFEAARPSSVLRVAITYYTGLVDTVPHVPERCYIGDGFDITTWENRAADCGRLPDGAIRHVPFRMINFEDQTGRQRVSRDVAYFFHVNGRYESDSLGVRRSLQNLFERYGYFAKVELMTTSPDRAVAQHEQVASTLTDFMTALLPELEERLPDWSQAHAAGRQVSAVH